LRKQSKQQISGRDGERWFVAMLPPAWLFTRPAEDFGIDGIVTIGTDASVSELEFSVQIKSRSRWRKQGGYLIVPDIETEVIRYWTFRLAPTLLVAYERESGCGYYEWVPDASAAQDSEILNKSAQNLRIPLRQEVNAKAWTEIEECLRDYHQRLRMALRRSDAQRAVLKTVRAMSMCLRVLQMTPQMWRKGEEGRIFAGVSHAVAHAEVVNTLRQLAETMDDDDPPLAQTVRDSATAYASLCSTFLYPFEEFLLQRDQAVAVLANENRMKRMRSKMEAMISEIIMQLSSV
jgi:hypothetical protein